VKGLTIEQVIEGLKETVLEFHGEVWLEVLLVAGINDPTMPSFGARAMAVREIRPGPGADQHGGASRRREAMSSGWTTGRWCARG
jgi:hypothetical protein